MHILVAVEGYTFAVEKWKTNIEKKQHPYQTKDGKLGIGRAVLREVKLYDIVYPKVVEKAVLADIQPTYARRNRFARLFHFFLNLLKPKGFRPPTIYNDLKVTDEVRNIKIFAIAEKADSFTPDGKFENL